VLSTVRLADARMPPEWASTIQAALNAAQVAWPCWLPACSAAQFTMHLGPAMPIMIAAIAAGVFAPTPKLTM
jgi:hypothetical protein